MSGRDWALVALFVALMALAGTLAAVTADMEPCWPNCEATQ